MHWQLTQMCTQVLRRNWPKTKIMGGSGIPKQATAALDIEPVDQTKQNILNSDPTLLIMPQIHRNRATHLAQYSLPDDWMHKAPA